MDRRPGLVVVPDRCGEGQDTLQDAHEHAGRCVPAVSFEVKVGFEGLEASPGVAPCNAPLILAFAQLRG